MAASTLGPVPISTAASVAPSVVNQTAATLGTAATMSTTTTSSAFDQLALNFEHWLNPVNFADCHPTQQDFYCVSGPIVFAVLLLVGVLIVLGVAYMIKHFCCNKAAEKPSIMEDIETGTSLREPDKKKKKTTKKSSSKSSGKNKRSGGYDNTAFMN
ncbi:membrane protein [Crucian carp herpesvirus]|uniref:Membrane ORF132 n=1 Tax=Cyprinid herpesvirus 2 TaxID=317878 RepID=K7PCE4_CYHV2|nr:membrane protein ORF132 [Cyprinid herpesvirus 2]APB92976.1 membrane protein [Crucian carp herpesvirus]AFJ20557.1 membrane protein ORF132 [Cyprinid herpesvirus 2]AKC02075.1 hypothetical protein [Cyprinid herpesvirus 2]AMB21701.1 membrane ORF132 [Cyprinid herpesvirus 2]QAU54854.1 membrane protein ORF132 [Cyprinid herpesvirus 2]